VGDWLAALPSFPFLPPFLVLAAPHWRRRGEGGRTVSRFDRSASRCVGFGFEESFCPAEDDGLFYLGVDAAGGVGGGREGGRMGGRCGRGGEEEVGVCVGAFGRRVKEGGREGGAGEIEGDGVTEGVGGESESSDLFPLCPSID